MKRIRSRPDQRRPGSRILQKVRQDADGRVSRLWVMPLLVFLLGSLVASWPLAMHLASRIPLGSEPSPTVPYFNLWTLGWTSTWLAHRDGSYWDASIFHPVPGTLAFSDPQPLSGLLATLLWPIHRALAYNAVLLVFLWLNGLLTFRLLRHRGISPIVALLAGLLMQWLPFVTHERGVLQLQPVFGIVWAIDGLWRLADRPAPAVAAELALAVAVSCFTSEYYGIFLIGVFVSVVIVRWSRFRRLRSLAALGGSLAAAGLLVLLILLPQPGHLGRMGFERSATTIRAHSARGADYLRRSELTLGAHLLGAGDRTASSHPLSPGLVLTMLSLAGLAAAWRSKVDRRWVGCLLLLVALAFLGSFGPNLALAEISPYEATRRFVPGLGDLRSPFRLGVVVQMALVLLAASALQWLWQDHRRRLACAAFALAAFEAFPLPARLVPLPEALPAGALQGPVVFLPYATGRSSAAYTDTTAVMVAMQPTRARLVNGFSGYFPDLNGQLKTLLADFPSPAGLQAIQALGVRTLLVERARLDQDQRHRLADLLLSGAISDAGSFWELRAYELRDARLRPGSEYEGRWELAAAATSDELILRALPLGLDEQCYVVAPETAPLGWTLRITSPAGAVRERPAEPKGAFLLCEGGGDGDVTLRTSRPRTSGAHRIELLAAGGTRVVAAGSLTLP